MGDKAGPPKGERPGCGAFSRFVARQLSFRSLVRASADRGDWRWLALFSAIGNKKAPGVARGFSLSRRVAPVHPWSDDMHARKKVHSTFCRREAEDLPVRRSVVSS
jgi:hypothetical protein